MLSSRKTIFAFLSLVLVAVLSTVALAADPGDPLDTAAGAVTNDQRAGSMLFFNYYTSSTTNPGVQNTSIAITNTSTSQVAFVHLFFIDGITCSVADRFICLTNSQTTTFYASEQDPGVTGFIVALAVDFDGLPKRFNYLIGVEYLKTVEGRADAFGAEAYVKYSDTNVVSTDGSLAALFFDGLNLAGSYSMTARVVALDNIPSPLDGNQTFLVLNRIGGNLGTANATLGNIFGILYDESEQAHSFTLNGGCQLRQVLSDEAPRTSPRFSRVIPQGSIGWIKMFSQSDVGISGLMINSNATAGTSVTAFNGGHNLHKLRLSAAANYVIPIFPPSC